MLKSISKWFNFVIILESLYLLHFLENLSLYFIGNILSVEWKTKHASNVVRAIIHVWKLHEKRSKFEYFVTILNMKASDITYLNMSMLLFYAQRFKWRINYKSKLLNEYNNLTSFFPIAYKYFSSHNRYTSFHLYLIFME